MQPSAFGGYELPYGAHTTIAMEIARHCVSSAWAYSVTACHSWILGMFPAQAQKAYGVNGVGLGGSEAARKLAERMLTESPAITRLIKKHTELAKADGVTEGTLKTMRQSILNLLSDRFDSYPTDFETVLFQIEDESRLRELQRAAAKCANLDAFAVELRSQT